MAFIASQLRRSDMFAQIADFASRTDTTTYVYKYRTLDLAAVVEAADYFDAATFLQPGDIVDAVMNNGVGLTPVLKQYIVTAAISAGAAHNVVGLLTTVAG